MTELARYQDNPHVHFDPLMMMGAAGAATEAIKVGVCVTDTIRRHPAMLAQAALTADHLSRRARDPRPRLGRAHEHHALRDELRQAGRACSRRRSR